MGKFLKAFFTLFVAMNVIGILPIFFVITESLSNKEKNKTIIEGVSTAFLITFIFIFLGNWLFKILGIETGDFMIACGIVLLVLSIMILTESYYPKEVKRQRIAVVPLGTPLLAGPGLLTTSIMMSSLYGYQLTAISLLIVSIISGLILFTGAKIYKIIGEEGIKGISKIASLFLAGIGVMIVRKGIDFFK
ncbi:MAG: MarC family protein [Candidatus Omnitrophica bacterium]|nr:MarC family protein [Candidatus Omnitrophota bacterium]